MGDKFLINATAEDVKVVWCEEVEILCLLIQSVLVAVCHQFVVLHSLLQMLPSHMFEVQCTTKCRLANSVVTQCEIVIVNVLSQHTSF